MPAGRSTTSAKSRAVAPLRSTPPAAWQRLEPNVNGQSTPSPSTAIGHLGGFFDADRHRASPLQPRGGGRDGGPAGLLGTAADAPCSVSRPATGRSTAAAASRRRRPAAELSRLHAAGRSAVGPVRRAGRHAPARLAGRTPSAAHRDPPSRSLAAGGGDARRLRPGRPRGGQALRSGAPGARPHGVAFDGSGLASGVYLCALRAATRRRPARSCWRSRRAGQGRSGLKFRAHVVAALAPAGGHVRAAAWSWSQAPEPIPMHWDLRGRPDGFGGRSRACWRCPWSHSASYTAAALPAPRRSQYARTRSSRALTTSSASPSWP